MTQNKDVVNLLKNVNRRKLTNNRQRVLLTLLTSKSEWLSTESIRVSSAARRVQELRQPEFGGFSIERTTAGKLKKNPKNTRQAFYRINSETLTVTQVQKAFEGVI